MQAVVKKVKINKSKRIIAISDIHGNLELLKKLLSKANYTQNDALFLVGDLIEKGQNSLETLRYIIELSKKQEVYVVSGNCDFLWEDVKGYTDEQEVLDYMLHRKKSMLNEMCSELSIDVSEKSDMSYIKEQLLNNFSEELNWLEALPHIIETDDYIFAHAGITSENLTQNKAHEVVRRDAFMEEEKTFSKYVIVGHWPTANYCKEKGCCNPIINKEQKIISIDGGNTIKDEGQLNALIIEGEVITFASEDNFPKGKVLENQEQSSNSIQITWNDNAIELLKKGAEFSFCKHISSNHKLWIKNDKIFEADNVMRTYDCTDYFIEAKAGDIVSVIDKTSQITLVKKNGVFGWIKNEKIKGV